MNPILLAATRSIGLTKEVKMSSKLRNDIRGQILGAQVAKTIKCKFFNAEIEVRQPTLGEILQAEETGTKTDQAISMLIKYCYVPGTMDKVFEEADKDVLKTLPFGEDFIRVQKAIAQLTSVNVEDALGNSETTSEDSTF